MSRYRREERLRKLEAARQLPRYRPPAEEWLRLLHDDDLDVMEVCLDVEAGERDRTTVPDGTWARYGELTAACNRWCEEWSAA